MKTSAVTQICNLLYRRFSTCRHGEQLGGCADCKSAIQQIKNLRYAGNPGNPAKSRL